MSTPGSTALAVALIATFASAAAPAEELAGEPSSERSSDGQHGQPTIEEILVTGRRVSLDEAVIEPAGGVAVDSAQALRNAPGAAVNTNGRLSGIAQYRGMYGDRVAVSLDGVCPIGGGPNAMDAPLSYASPMLLSAIHVERGIAGVAEAAEGIGGHIDARIDRGQFGESPSTAAHGWLGTRYAANGDTMTTAGRLTLANERHRLSASSSIDDAGDIATPAGTIRPSALHRERHDMSYGWRGGATEIGAFVGRLDTTDSGTPSLPMDIRYIDTDLYGAELATRIGGVDLTARAAHNDVDHVMDNYTLRESPPPARQRQNHTRGRGTELGLSALVPAGAGELTLGIDGRFASHEAVITNPNNPLFRIDNFADVERDRIGVFAEWRTPGFGGDWTLGARHNRVYASAGTVGTRGLMGMMAAGADALAASFNAADRDLEFDSPDLVLSYQRRLGKTLTGRIELGSRARAPAYQELFLWLPLEATGGLADGRTYIGNPGLRAERSHEINLGLEFDGGRLQFSPQLYLKRIDDYIQGTPATDPVANSLSVMMSGAPALMFTNVDAEIYGLDLAWRYRLVGSLSLEGVAAATRGNRRDADDKLYRLSPDSASLALVHDAGPLGLRAELVAYRRQDRVSAYNGETATSGYALFNLGARWQPTNALSLEAGIENLLNRRYVDHLTGINRAAGSDIPVGARLPGGERSLTAGASYRF